LATHNISELVMLFDGHNACMTVRDTRSIGAVTINSTHISQLFLQTL
jgi:hypothetical protein